MEKLNKSIRLDGRKIYAAAVLLLFIYYMLKQVNEGLWYSIYCVYYLYLSPVLIAFGLYFSRRGKPLEFKIYTLFCLWLYVSRLLNGDYFLTFDGAAVLDICLSCAFFAVCLVLKPWDRFRYLDWLSIAVGAFYTLVGIAVLYGVILQRELTNPIFYGKLLNFEDLMYRARVLGESSNESVMWFFISFFLLLYLFVRKKKLLWRIVIVPAEAINYLCMVATFSRSGRLAFSAGVALLVGLAALKLPSMKTRSKKAFTAAIVTCAVLPIAYLSFDAAAAGVRLASDTAITLVGDEDTEQETASPAASPAAAAEATPTAAAAATPGAGSEQKGENTETASSQFMYQDSRGLNDSGRFEVYKSIIPTIQREPLRLLRGCKYQDVMGVANTVLKNYKVHFHNTFLQSLAFTGLPGLILCLAFCILLTVKIIRLYFSPAPFELKVLSMILVGSLMYNMLEVSLFYYADIRTHSFFLIAGAVLAWFRDEAHEKVGEERRIRG